MQFWFVTLFRFDEASKFIEDSYTHYFFLAALGSILDDTYI